MDTELKTGAGMIEYIIWGVPPGGDMEVVLIDINFGKPITDRKHAEGLVRALEQDYKCTKVRIHEFDPGAAPNFTSKTLINI